MLSDRAKAVPPSGIRKYFDIAAKMENVISLGIGEPDFKTPSTILQAGVQSLLDGHTAYTSNAGMIELRELLAENIQTRYGVHYDPDKELLITVGGSEALDLAIRAIINPGDEVIVPEPCFVAYKPDVILAGGVPIPTPTFFHDDFQLSTDYVNATITDNTKALLFSYPNNPTGAVMSRERLLELADLVDKEDMLVISDEIYDRLVYGIDHVCFAALPNMQRRTILIGGFSKTYAMTGWRIGYIAAPAEIMEGIYKIHQYGVMCAPTPAQHAAVEALKHGDNYVSQMVAEYDRRRRLIVDGLNNLGLDCFEPRGAFYAFPSIIKTGMDDTEFAKRLLLEEKVALVPGSAFGESGKGFMRCSYATSYEKIEEALHRMEKFMNRYG